MAETSSLPNFESLEKVIKDGNSSVREEIEKNTRAVRCLEKSVLLHTQVGQKQNEVLTETRDEIRQFVLYYRGCMREARRKEEDDRQKDRLAEEKKRKREEDENTPCHKPKSVLGDLRVNISKKKKKQQ